MKSRLLLFTFIATISFTDLAIADEAPLTQTINEDAINKIIHDLEISRSRALKVAFQADEAINALKASILKDGTIDGEALSAIYSQFFGKGSEE